jgi:hypothetical protein
MDGKYTSAIHWAIHAITALQMKQFMFQLKKAKIKSLFNQKEHLGKETRDVN